MARFWIPDNFIRVYARDLKKHKAQMVYIALCCHCNAEGRTFIGYRKIGEYLSMNKETVGRAIKLLEAYGLVRRSEYKIGRASELKILSVRFDGVIPSGLVVPKEEIKEYTKEEKNQNIIDSMEKMLEGLSVSNPAVCEQYKKRIEAKKQNDQPK
ncbi:MAG: helix-turn-helix domain-containing protein [Patescibacteria group bacterium]|nr:helix-turn-helix domain-containing protein [Patescibacteria group bacterium]